MIKLTLLGKTYGIKEELKAQGFRWDSTNKAWYKLFDENESDRVERLAEAYKDNGVVGKTEKINAPKEAKKYLVKEDWIFNLESMSDKLWCIADDIEEGKIKTPVEICGYTINTTEDVFRLRDEASMLEWKAKSGAVTGSEYGRIKEIVNWRVLQRYVACINSGMEESKAAVCFNDL